jgi:hypothetical protein
MIIISSGIGPDGDFIALLAFTARTGIIFTAADITMT